MNATYTTEKRQALSLVVFSGWAIAMGGNGLEPHALGWSDARVRP